MTSPETTELSLSDTESRRCNIHHHLTDIDRADTGDSCSEPQLGVAI